MSRLSIILFMVAIMAVSGNQIAHAGSITVRNASFEDPVLDDGDYTWSIPDWSQGYYGCIDYECSGYQWLLDSQDAGVLDPDSSAFTGGAAPQGDNVAWLYLNWLDEGMSQELDATLEVDMEYVLSVQVGNPKYNPGPITAPYRLELLAGGVLLESDTGASPGSGEWELHSLTYNYNSDPDHKPALLGEKLEVRLIVVDDPCCNYGGYEVHFDDVLLTATAVQPSPNTPAEQDVTVDLGSGETVTFDNVTAPGNTTLTTSDTPPGDSFFINFIPVFYDINTTATFDGNVSIEITYDDSDILPALEPFLRLFKFKGSPPVATDITDYRLLSPNPDTVENKIVGVTNGFSIFAVGVPVKQVAIVDLLELLPTGDHKTDKKIEKAIKHIEKSLALESDSTLTKKGKKVFDEDKKAVKDLQKLIKDKKVADEDKDVCENVTDELLTIDELLAQTALDEAIAYDGTDKKVDKEIEKAEKELEKATKELEKGKPDKAIDHYKKAWEHAQHAMKKLSKPE